MSRRFYKHHIVGNEVRWRPPVADWRKGARRPRRRSRLVLIMGFALLMALALAGLLIG
jgi:hypothetical protein